DPKTCAVIEFHGSQPKVAAPGPSDETQEDLVGQTLDDRWTIDARLGAGGMGTVWRARDREDRAVAIKVLRTELLHTEDLFARFQQEADAASRIGNQHIVSVLGFGHTPSGAPYYAMRSEEHTSELQSRENLVCRL